MHWYNIYLFYYNTYNVNCEDNRKYFKDMYKLKKQYGMDILSMGMSNDYQAAILEHSNYIRICTKIFGSR